MYFLNSDESTKILRTRESVNSEDNNMSSPCSFLDFPKVKEEMVKSYPVYIMTNNDKTAYKSLHT